MLTVLNDLHIGVIRSAGTTPTSQFNLRKYLLQQFGELLANTKTDLMILGDLFDTSVIPMYDFYAAFSLLSHWIDEAKHTLYLVPGNHDLSKTSTTLSSFQLLCKILSNYDDVVVLDGPEETDYGYVIPHMPNQDLFNDALTKVPACNNLFLHCNYNNHFAVESDQSLNLAASQVETLPCENIIIAHEHQYRKIGDKIWIPGNQIPSSISDLLGCTKKYVLMAFEEAKPTLSTFLETASVYLELNWKQLQSSNSKFIRIVGEAKPEEASEVVSAISKYRQQSEAFVIANAVKIKSEDSAENFAENLESVKSFDVMAALKETLTAEEFSVIERLE